MKVVYIIGPFRAENSWLIEQNIRRAEEMALTLWKEGFAVICPHTNTRFFNGALGNNDKIFLEGDKEILKRCDCAFVLDGSFISEGSKAEITMCKLLKIPIYSNIISLIAIEKKFKKVNKCNKCIHFT